MSKDINKYNVFIRKLSSLEETFSEISDNAEMNEDTSRMVSAELQTLYTTKAIVQQAKFNNNTYLDAEKVQDEVIKLLDVCISYIDKL